MRSQGPAVELGALVQASDGPLGMVEELNTSAGGAVAQLVVRSEADSSSLSIPADYIRAISPDGVVHLALSLAEARGLRLGGVDHAARPDAEADRWAGTTAEGARIAGSNVETVDRDSVRVPVIEEQLQIDKRVVETGEVRVHKHVETVEAVVEELLQGEVVDIQRVKVERRVDRRDMEQTRQEGEWMVIPIVEEVLVTEKVLMVTEEIRVRKRPVTERHEVRETLRREIAEVESVENPPAAPERRRAAVDPNEQTVVTPRPKRARKPAVG